MKWEDEQAESLRAKLFTKDGKPLRILSTSLGLALLANAAFGTITYAAGDAAGNTGAEQPKLVEWSSDEVKQYYDPAVDWNIPMLDDTDADGGVQPDSGAGTSGGAGSGGSGGDTIIINNGSSSSFGWDDLILYHLLFNRGSSYSTTHWYTSHTTYTTTTHQPYKAKKYTSDSFQNKPVVGSTVRPKTTNGSGSVTRRSSTKSTTSKPGGIGGQSSALSTKSSGSSSSRSSSRSFGGFGG